MGGVASSSSGQCPAAADFSALTAADSGYLPKSPGKIVRITGTYM
jgi:hypothetical protein